MRSSSRCRTGDVVEVGQKVQAGLDMVAVGQSTPVVPVNITRGEPVDEVSFVDAGEDGFGGIQLDCVAGAIDAPRVALKILGEGQRLQ